MFFNGFPALVLRAVVTVYPCGRQDHCNEILVYTFVPLSVTPRGFFLCIDQIEILSPPLFGVLFLPDLLPPAQQTCLTSLTLQCMLQGPAR